MIETTGNWWIQNIVLNETIVGWSVLVGSIIIGLICLISIVAKLKQWVHSW